MQTLRLALFSFLMVLIAACGGVEADVAIDEAEVLGNASVSAAPGATESPTVVDVCRTAGVSISSGGVPPSELDGNSVTCHTGGYADELCPMCGARFTTWHQGLPFVHYGVPLISPRIRIDRAACNSYRAELRIYEREAETSIFTSQKIYEEEIRGFWSNGACYQNRPTVLGPNVRIGEKVRHVIWAPQPAPGENYEHRRVFFSAEINGSALPVRVGVDPL